MVKFLLNNSVFYEYSHLLYKCINLCGESFLFKRSDLKFSVH